MDTYSVVLRDVLSPRESEFLSHFATRLTSEENPGSLMAFQCSKTNLEGPFLRLETEHGEFQVPLGLVLLVLLVPDGRRPPLFVHPQTPGT